MSTVALAVPGISRRVAARAFVRIARFAKQTPLGAGCAGIILALVIMAVIGPYVAPHDPDLLGASPKYLAPSLDANLLGTDQLGRDVLSRILHGTWISLVVGVVASTAGTLIGAAIGLAGGYWGGRIDALSQRLVDILMAFPVLILALALVAALGPSLRTIIVAIAVPFIPYGARVVRASAMVIKETQYVEAARAMGCSDLRIMLRHIGPGCFAPYLVVLTGLIGVAILTESALGFLGLGVPPPTPTWGEMLSNALALLWVAPHVAIIPGIFITLSVFSFSVLGDSLRDVLDPRLRGRT